MNRITTYLALGSNLGDRLANLRKGRELLAPLSLGKIISAPVYETDPLDCPESSPPFLNTVLSFDSSLSSLEFLNQTQAIENELGRLPLKNRPTNAPRLLDIDILLYGDTVFSTVDLTLPHPRLHQRFFVLYPLRDIAPSLTPPTHANPISILLELCETSEAPPQIHLEEW